jgi:Tol biopolymer transport system component
MLKRLLPFVFLVACSRADNQATADAPVNHPDARSIDATTQVDSHVFTDAQMTGPASRVWVIGDFTTDQTLQAGSFMDGVTLPFGGAGSPPPLVVPTAPAKLPSVTGYTASVFDATPDASKIAYVADATTAGTFDLYFANGDGSAPALLVAGQTGVEIQSIAISPDGTKVAYVADSAAINGGYDLYFVNTAGTPTPVKVSPDRPANSPAPAAQDVFSVVTWSADSKYLAFSADLTNDTFDQAYCVDTNVASTPLAVALLARTDIGTQASGAQGVRGALLFDSNNNVYFRARLVVGDARFQLFKATPDGVTRSDVTAFVPARGDATVPDIGAFGVSPDGTKIVISADAPTATQYDLYAVAFANTATSTKLTSLTAAGHTDFTAPLWFAPDGTRVAYVANFASARREPFVSKLDGTDTHRLVSVTTTCTGCATPDADSVQWTADSTALYVAGDLTANNDTKLYRVDSASTDQTPALAVDVPTGGDIVLAVVRRQ